MKKIVLSFILIISVILSIIFFTNKNEDIPFTTYTLYISNDLIIDSDKSLDLNYNFNKFLAKYNQDSKIKIEIKDTNEILPLVDQGKQTIAFVPSDSFINYQLQNRFSNIKQLYIAMKDTSSDIDGKHLSQQSINYSPYIISLDKQHRQLGNKNIAEVLEIIIDQDLKVGILNNSGNYGKLWLYYCTKKSNQDFNRLSFKSYDTNDELYHALNTGDVDLMISDLPKYIAKAKNPDYHFLNFPQYADTFLNPLIIYNDDINADQKETYLYFFKEMFNNSAILDNMQKTLAWTNIQTFKGATNVSESRTIIEIFKDFNKNNKENYEKNR